MVYLRVGHPNSRMRPMTVIAGAICQNEKPLLDRKAGADDAAWVTGQTLILAGGQRQ
jgi:hypothetical protein